MKLRMRGSSVRLRLTRGEVDALASKGRVEESASFPGGGRFAYALATGRDAARVTARFDGTTLLVTVPEAQARTWAGNEEVGFEAEERTESGETLRVLVEKDFACLKPREGEDDEDAYPHPKAETGESC